MDDRRTNTKKTKRRADLPTLLYADLPTKKRRKRDGSESKSMAAKNLRHLALRLEAIALR